MKDLIFRLGDWMCEVGERKGLRFLVYNPITWSRFLISARRSGAIFAKALVEVFPSVKSVLDVGAGTGGYVAKLRDAGYHADGLEFSRVGRALARLQGVKIGLFDCSKAEGIPDLPKVDLAYSIEVGEHLPADLAGVFVDYICGRSDVVVFSAAFPGQGGQGHINEQPKEYWCTKFERNGFRFCGEKSLLLERKLEEFGFRGWFPKNVQVFFRDLNVGV